MKIETQLVSAGVKQDQKTGAISTPIYQCATFAHPALGESTGYDYSRTANPTRTALETTLATIDGAAAAYTFASGMAALDATLRLLEPGSCILVTEDPYGGTVRLLDHICKKAGVTPIYLDTSNTELVRQTAQSTNIAAILVEMPTNPLLRVADIYALSEIAHQQEALLIVDNTFLTPYFFRPLDYGADIVIYSATKYLSGHNDVVAGSVSVKEAALGEKIAFIQNAAGAILGPMDAWLVLRGLKTLSIRLDRQQANALQIATWLEHHQQVKKVYYPGLPKNPYHDILKRQSNGYGAMISFEIDNPEKIAHILSTASCFSYAESLGGVESLITYPVLQTHADMEAHILERLGINNRLLRLSIGIEHVDDLIQDLSRMLD